MGMKPEGLNVRLEAVRALEDLSRPGRRLDSLSSRPRFGRLDLRDRRLLMQLAYGVERWRGRLDYYIEQASSRPSHKIDPPVRWVLRLALFQLEFLRVPPRAAVHQAVECCRRLGKSSAAGFVNALLRRFLREPPDLPPGPSAEALAVRWSHPLWLVRRWLDRFGAELCERVLERNCSPPENHLWINTHRISVEEFRGLLQAEGIEHRDCSGLPQCLILPNASLTEHPLYRRGLCFFMDAASQAVAQLPSLEGRRVLGDFCSAPGGKSLVLASRMHAQARLHCCDISFRRLAAARRRARICRLPRLDHCLADWEAAPVFAGSFDFILADVPCSGLGTLQANPDIRWKVEEADLERHSQRQSRILSCCFKALRPGGELLYSTCSTEPEENQRVVEDFLHREALADPKGEPFRSFPLKHPGGGFYAALIRHG